MGLEEIQRLECPSRRGQTYKRDRRNNQRYENKTKQKNTEVLLLKKKCVP